MGGKKTDGTGWTVEDFLLDFTPKVQKQQAQTAEQIEQVFRMWVDANNLRFANGESN